MLPLPPSGTFELQQLLGRKHTSVAANVTCPRCHNLLPIPLVFTESASCLEGDAPEHLLIGRNRTPAASGSRSKIRTTVKYSPNIKFGGYEWRWVGTVVHLGERIGAGHYVAVVRVREDGGFCRINDATVGIEKSQGEAWDEEPYVLLYQKGAIAAPPVAMDISPVPSLSPPTTGRPPKKPRMDEEATALTGDLARDLFGAKH